MKVLSIDGGGCKGLIAAYILSEIEKEVGKPCNEIFDIIVGTSTGGIIAAAIANGFPARDVVSMYIKMAKKIFPSFFPRISNRISRTFSQGFSAPKYNEIPLKEFLKEIFGDKTIGELSTTLIIPTYNLFDEEDFIIKNNKYEHKNFKIWEVCLATTAAPTFFPSYKLDSTHILIDGGLVSNNPCLIGMSEAIKQKDITPKDLILVSIGTGKYKDLNNDIHIKSSKMGLLEWMSYITQIMLDGSNESTGYIANKILDNNKYFRLQPTIDNKLSKMDNAKNLKKLLLEAKKYVKTKHFKVSIDEMKNLINE